MKFALYKSLLLLLLLLLLLWHINQMINYHFHFFFTSKVISIWLLALISIPGSFKITEAQSTVRRRNLKTELRSSVHINPEKLSTETELFENALENGGI